MTELTNAQSHYVTQIHTLIQKHHVQTNEPPAANPTCHAYIIYRRVMQECIASYFRGFNFKVYNFQSNRFGHQLRAEGINELLSLCNDDEGATVLIDDSAEVVGNTIQKRLLAISVFNSSRGNTLDVGSIVGKMSIIPTMAVYNQVLPFYCKMQKFATV